ncbi:MAG: hypothetical protein HGA19_08925 [Oscillochloris sp.]|nr:hypothetical protein [Oscillochloris sp.]
MPTREAWQTQLEQRLPPLSALVARNRAITAFYARWYLQEPWLFKWSGMAAFASDQVGIALALMEILQAPHDMLAKDGPLSQSMNLFDLGRSLYGQALSIALAIPLALHDATTRQLLLTDLDLIKQGNDAIFADIGWAHAAYIAGGIKEIEANVRDGEQESLLAGFRMIDEGAHRLAKTADDQDGVTLIAQGNIALLRHEQMNTLPCYFDRMTNLGRSLASVGAWLDFEGTPKWGGQPWFGGHAGPWSLLSGGKSVTNPTDRWNWIECDVLPKWAQVDAAYHEGCAMHCRLVSLANESPTMLRQAVGVLRPVYRALSLK